MVLRQAFQKVSLPPGVAPLHFGWFLIAPCSLLLRADLFWVLDPLAVHSSVRARRKFPVFQFEDFLITLRVVLYPAGSALPMVRGGPTACPRVPAQSNLRWVPHHPFV